MKAVWTLSVHTEKFENFHAGKSFMIYQMASSVVKNLNGAIEGVLQLDLPEN